MYSFLFCTDNCVFKCEKDTRQAGALFSPVMSPLWLCWTFPRTHMALVWKYSYTRCSTGEEANYTTSPWNHAVGLHHIKLWFLLTFITRNKAQHLSNINMCIDIYPSWQNPFIINNKGPCSDRSVRHVGLIKFHYLFHKVGNTCYVNVRVFKTIISVETENHASLQISTLR